MLNKAKHEILMKQVLDELYKDISLAPSLGFKGGTAAFMFYGLNRFSVDLDFDLLMDNPNEAACEIIKNKIANILSRYGQVKKADIKRYTIFLLLSYGDADHNLKVEISRRKPGWLTRDYFELKDQLGLPMLVAKPGYIFTSKLTALTTRKNFATRDVFDVDYYCKNRWDIDETIIKQVTGKSIKKYLVDCIAVIEKINEREILAGMGELLQDAKQKAWVKNHLKKDVLFLLKNYLSAL